MEKREVSPSDIKAFIVKIAFGVKSGLIGIFITYCFYGLKYTAGDNYQDVP